MGTPTPCDCTLEDEFFRRNELGRDDVALSANDAVTLALGRSPTRLEYGDLAPVVGPVAAEFADRTEPASDSVMLSRLVDRPSVDHFDSTVLPTLLVRPASDRVTEYPRDRCALESVVTSSPVNASINLLTSASTARISCRISAAVVR